MMNKYTHGHGPDAERSWIDKMKRRGTIIIPTASLVANTHGTSAPMGVDIRGNFVLPDALTIGTVFSSDGKPQQLWTEVKSKEQPGWLKWATRWEHGIDLSSFEEYIHAETATHIPIVIVIHECNSPEMVSKPSSLVPSDLFLAAPLTLIKDKGRHEREWPKKHGEESRGRRGGWLWPRDIMCGVDGPCNCVARYLSNQLQIEVG